jgi:hypothetical protein
VVAFLKKSSAKDFYNPYTGAGSVPREQKSFAELFQKRPLTLTYEIPRKVRQDGWWLTLPVRRTP